MAGTKPRYTQFRFDLPKAVTLASGAFEADEDFALLYVLTPESGNVDDLTTITFPNDTIGAQISLIAAAGKQIVVKSGGNITTPATFPFTDESLCIVRWDGTAWIPIMFPSVGNPYGGELTIDAAGDLVGLIPGHYLYLIDTYGDAAADDLNGIEMPDWAVNREFTFWTASASRDVTLKHNTAGSGLHRKMYLPGATDVALDNSRDVIKLIATSGGWICSGFSNNAT